MSTTTDVLHHLDIYDPSDFSLYARCRCGHEYMVTGSHRTLDLRHEMKLHHINPSHIEDAITTYVVATSIERDFPFPANRFITTGYLADTLHWDQVRVKNALKESVTVAGRFPAVPTTVIAGSPTITAIALVSGNKPFTASELPELIGVHRSRIYEAIAQLQAMDAIETLKRGTYRLIVRTEDAQAVAA